LQIILNEIAELRKLRQRLLDRQAEVNLVWPTLSDADRERFKPALRAIDSIDTRLQNICNAALMSVQPVGHA
jgi:hypothetical protein